MQKIITLTLLAITLTSCGSKAPCGSLKGTVKTYEQTQCKFEIKPSYAPLERLLSDDPFNLYEDKVEIPYLPTPKSEEIPTFNLSCVDL